MQDHMLVLQIKTKDNVWALPMSISEMIIIPPTGTSGTQISLLLPHTQHVFFHITAEGTDWDRQNTYISHDMHLAF
jgi:hypothetical protein